MYNPTDFYNWCQNGDIESITAWCNEADKKKLIQQQIHIIGFIKACKHHQFAVVDHITTIFNSGIMFYSVYERLISICTDYAIFNYINEWFSKNFKIDLLYNISCKHGTADTCPTCNKLYHENLKTLYIDLKTNWRYDEIHAMKLIIAYADILVKTYQLTECDALISETIDWVNANLSETSTYIKYIQSVAVLRFKQKRFRECAAHYETVRLKLGDSYAIYENLAHVYNSCNELVKAADCISKALTLTESDSSKAGLYLALSVNLCARDKVDEALTQALCAMRIYDTQTSTTPNTYPTLSAKARMTVARCYEQSNDLPNALKYYSEAATTFTTTCGLINPLTFDALKNQGYMLAALHRWSEAVVVLTNALNVGTKLDAKCIDQAALCQIAKILTYAKKMKDN